MSVKVTFTFASTAEATAFLMAVAPPRSASAVPVPLPVDKPDKLVIEKPAKPKITPKPNTGAGMTGTPPQTAASGVSSPTASMPAPVPPKPTAAVPVVTAPPAPIIAPGVSKAEVKADGLTLEAVRNALRVVFNKPGGTGAAAATSLLKKYNATSVSNVKPEDYAAFIKDCQ